MPNFGAVLYDNEDASDERPRYAVTTEPHVENANGAKGAQGAGDVVTRSASDASSANDSRICQWRPGYAVRVVPIFENNRRLTALFECL